MVRQLGFAVAGWALLHMNNDDFDLPPELLAADVTRLGHSSELRSSGTSTAYRCSTARSITSTLGRSWRPAPPVEPHQPRRPAPTFSHDAPAIARSQTWKAIIRHWRDQVIADAALMIKKFRCHHRAHQVAGLSPVQSCSSRRDRNR